MNKFVKFLVFGVASLVLSGCLSMTTTQQDVTKLAKISAGMNEAEVIAIMGEPAAVEFSGDNKALHYCKTGYGGDSFAVVVLKSGIVTAAKNYGVSVGQAGGTGDCSKFIRNIFE